MRTVQIAGKTWTFDPANELKGVILNWAFWKTEIVGEVGAEIGIAKVAEHKLLRPQRKKVIFVLTSLEFTDLRGQMSAVKAWGDCSFL